MRHECIARDTAAQAQPAPAAPASALAAAALGRVAIIGTRPVPMGPLPGLNLRRDQLPANVQSAARADLKDVALQFSDEPEAAHLCPPTDEFAAATGFAFRGSFDLGDGSLGVFAASLLPGDRSVVLDVAFSAGPP
jgi:hypothetical protein